MEFAPGILRAGFTSAPFMFSFGLPPPLFILLPNWILPKPGTVFFV